jgi:hypothetical protein
MGGRSERRTERHPFDRARRRIARFFVAGGHCPLGRVQWRQCENRSGATLRLAPVRDGTRRAVERLP